MSFDPRDPADPHDNRDRGYREGPPNPRDPDDYRDPLDRAAPSSEYTKQAARRKLMLPAILLIVAGIINLVAGGIGAITSVGIHEMTPEEVEKGMEQSNSGQLQDFKKQGYTAQDFKNIGFGFYLGLGIVGSLFGVVNLAGGVCMLTLKGWAVGVFGSALAIISPSCCCVFGMAAGIWSLVVLLNPDVRSSFG